MVDIARWVPLPQAAKAASISADRMRRNILRGEIASAFVANRWLVNPESLAAWIQHNAKEPCSGGVDPERATGRP